MAESSGRQVGELLVELFKRRGFTRSLRRAEAVLLWPRVVGHDVARFSSARSLDQGVLTVDVADSETAMHLSLQRRRFLERYRETYEITDVREIRFQVGRLTGDAQGASVAGTGSSPGRSAESAEGALEPREVAAMTRELERLQLSDDLGATVRLAGRSLLGLRARQRAAGFQPCPTCGALHDTLATELTPREATLKARQPDHPSLRERELCAGCRRSLREPRVKSEARRLALASGEADPFLSDAERAVAQRMATEYLDASLRDMLPRAVSQPALRPQLELVARRRCAVSTGKALNEIDDDDLQLLDASVVRYLGGSWT